MSNLKPLKRFSTTSFHRKDILPLVTSSTPEAQKPEQIKGIYGPIQQYYFSAKPGSPIFITNNKFFKLLFFPPEHFLGFFRKSRPALRVKYEGSYRANDPTITSNVQLTGYKSLIPSDYAVVRVNMRRLIRSAFLKYYKEQNGRDGYYVFHLNLLPIENNIGEFNKLIEKAVMSAKNVDCEKNNISTNKRVNYKTISHLIEQDGYDVPLEFMHFAEKVQLIKKTQSKSTKKKPTK